MRDRTFNKCPFIQLKEDKTDTSAHVGGGQLAAYQVRGKFTFKREIGSNITARNDLVSVLKTNNLFRVQINDTRDISPELTELEFVVECWDAIVE